uniref:Uncharacterized immunity region protein 12 n=1 Tax=Bacillus phage phi105 TaxID=10717 RepID=YIMC_BPPH1|nr:RecName: Full=Uncharacterized immunity region protein 12 [Bacillus phage phi105]AAA88397.1 unknown protein [Bacillus phage phi105]prf//1112178D ORF 12 [Bacillus phage phi105]
MTAISSRVNSVFLYWLTTQSGRRSSTAKVFASTSYLSTEKRVRSFINGVFARGCNCACPNSWEHTKVLSAWFKLELITIYLFRLSYL